MVRGIAPPDRFENSGTPDYNGTGTSSRRTNKRRGILHPGPERPCQNLSHTAGFAPMRMLPMKRGLRFQTKLMFTMFAVIAMVTVALILVTESKISQAYTRQFSQNFRGLVNQLERSHAERSQEFLELSRRLASF